MSMPTDYNQQLLCYLQNWRQLLEQWAAMAAGTPVLTAPPGGQFMPPTAPFMPFMQFMPPMPPTPPMPMGPPTPPVSPAPPAPADYAQQLFGYLQAWRQYLEQTAGGSPASPQTGAAQQPTAVPVNSGGNATSVRPPDVPIPPGNSAGSLGVPQSDDHKGSGHLPPKVVAKAPGKVQSQITATNSDLTMTPFDNPLEGIHNPREPFQMADPAALAARPIVSRPISESAARPEVGSAFLRTMNSVDPGAAAPIVRRSLFTTPGASETPSS
jgi:hypothetical protein